MHTIIERCYSPNYDMTFLLKCVYENDSENAEIISNEVVGFYHGAPINEYEDDTVYIGKLKVVYDAPI